MSESLYCHPEIDVQATAIYWRSLGYTVFSNSSIVGGRDAATDTLILLGIEATGSNGHHALIWALNERQRRMEERNRTHAIDKEAEAITALARAITQSSEENILERIMSRLTERTQYAVRQQLNR